MAKLGLTGHIQHVACGKFKKFQPESEARIEQHVVMKPHENWARK